MQEVVGWFRFRRNSTLTTSLRERAIHLHLLKCLPGMLAQNFVFLLCTLQQSPNKSTHTMDHVFQVYNGRLVTVIVVCTVKPVMYSHPQNPDEIDLTAQASLLHFCPHSNSAPPAFASAITQCHIWLSLTITDIIVCLFKTSTTFDGLP